MPLIFSFVQKIVFQKKVPQKIVFSYRCSSSNFDGNALSYFFRLLYFTENKNLKNICLFHSCYCTKLGRKTNKSKQKKKINRICIFVSSHRVAEGPEKGESGKSTFGFQIKRLLRNLLVKPHELITKSYYK